MPANTPTRNYPYPLDPDAIDPAGDIQRLAEAVDPDVNGIHTELGTNPSGSFATVAARLADVDADVANNTDMINNVGWRTSTLENLVLPQKRFAHVIYYPMTINDYEFPLMNIDRIGYGSAEQLITQVNSQSVVLNRNTCVAMSAMIPVMCTPGGPGSGVASCTIVVNGGIAVGDRHVSLPNLVTWLNCSVTWVWPAGSVIGLQFGCIYSNGFSAVNWSGVNPQITFCEIGP